MAEYLLRAPFSLEKITWNESTGKVIYRSKRSWHTKCNFQIFEAVDFLAAHTLHSGKPQGGFDGFPCVVAPGAHVHPKGVGAVR